MQFSPQPAFYGLGMPHVYWEQEIMSIQILLEAGTGTGVDGHMLLCFFETGRVGSGIHCLFLSLPFDQYGFLLSQCLVKLVWALWISTQLCLKGATFFGLPPQWNYGMHLMDSLVLSFLYLAHAPSWLTSVIYSSRHIPWPI